MPFFVWVRIAVRGRRRNLAQGAGSAKTGTGDAGGGDVCDDDDNNNNNNNNNNFMTAAIIFSIF